MLIISFGHRFELDLLGLSTLKAPPDTGSTPSGKDPLAEIQLALKASLIPDEGFFGLRAQLTSASYVLSKDCHLTGGFAFYIWFGGQHTGDFVITLGGYHPKFTAPEYYPAVPRLGFNWQVDSSILIKGGLYFALCSHALMAGGFLEASFHSGSVHAAFKVGADFLIAWKPYHYDGDLYIDINGGIGSLSLDLGASLHIWGPELGGHAEIHLFIISFGVSFGDQSSQQAQAIDWNTFRHSFLPKDEEICSLAISGGLIRAIEQEDQKLSIINPKQFSLDISSLIPSKTAQRGGVSVDLDEAMTAFGIGSMAMEAGDLETEMTITITREGNEDGVEEDFYFHPLLKNMPAALWGESLSPDLNGHKLIEDTVGGFRLTPAKAPKPGETHPIDRRHLQFDVQTVDHAYTWESLTPFVPQTAEEPGRRAVIRNTVGTNANRDDLLQALGFLPQQAVAMSPYVAGSFIIAPEIKEEAAA